MDRDSLMWVIECCVLALDETTKEQMLSYGCSEELADMGIKLCDVLKNK